MVKNLRVALIALALAAPAASVAQKAPPPGSPLVAKLSACRGIADDTQRLACFDRESASLVSAVTSGNVAVVDQGQLRAARRSLFGFQLPRLPFFSGDKSADDIPDQIESSIKAVEVMGRGRYRMTITDGAVWENIDSPMRLSEPEPGNKIVIKKGALGAYFLRINGQIGVKGHRIR